MDLIKAIIILFLGTYLLSYSQLYKTYLDSSVACDTRGDKKQSIVWSLKAEEIAKVEIGQKDTNYINIIDKISHQYLNLPDYSKAIEYCKNASELNKSNFGEKSFNYAQSIYNIGVIYIYAGDWDNAEAYYLKAKELYQQSIGKESYNYAQMLQVFNYIYRTRGNFEKAYEMLMAAKTIFEKINKINDFQYYFVLSDLSTILNLLEKFDEELGIRHGLNKLIEAGSNNSFDKLYADNLKGLAKIYSKRDKNDSADYYFKKCLAYQERDSSFTTDFYLTCLYEYAEFKQKLRNINESEILYKRIFELSEARFGTETKIYTMTINGLAKLYTEVARFNDAKLLYEKMNELDKKIYKNNSNEYANSLSWGGLFYWKIGDLQAANDLMKQSLKIKREVLGDKHQETGYIMNILGCVQLDLGNYEEAESLFLGNLKITSNLKGKETSDYSNSLYTLADFFKTIGQYDKSLNYFLECERIDKRLYGDTAIDYALTLHNLGHIYYLKGEMDKVEPIYNKVLGIFGKYGGKEHPRYASVLNNLALYYNEIGNDKQAIDYFNKAIDIYKNKLGESNHEYCQMINNLGYLYFKSGRYSEAEPLLTKAYQTRKKIFKDGHIGILNSSFDLARLYDLTGKKKESYELMMESMKLMTKLTNRYFTFMSEKEKVNFYNSYLKPYTNRFDVYAARNAQGNPEVTESLFDNQLIYKGLIYNSTKKVINSFINTSDSSLKSSFEDWKTLRTKLAYKVKERDYELSQNNYLLDSLYSRIEELEKFLSKKSDAFNKEFVEKKFNWKNIRNNLATDEAAIEIIRYNNDANNINYGFLIIKPDSKHPDLVVLNNGNDLEGEYIQIYKDLLERTNTRGTASKNKNSEEDNIYNAYWKDVQAKLNGINRIFLSLDGVYNLFNINTLRNPESGKYLLEELDIRIVTSTRDLIKTPPLNPPLKKGESQLSLAKKVEYAALFGDPTFDFKQEVIPPKVEKKSVIEIQNEGVLSYILSRMGTSNIMPLPGTKIEVEKVSANFEKNGWKTDKYIEASAMKGKLLSLKNPKILHIATHGVFLKDIEYLKEEIPGLEKKGLHENPLLKSMLLLSGSENTLKGDALSEDDDGILTAYEVMNLDLDKTELVVLSACETGLGEVKNGEGVFGLQRAFQTAGAKSIIMSLWKVNDKATQELMTNFYQKWLSGIDKRTAFRQSQLELKKKYPGFYYWGAFVMVGE